MNYLKSTFGASYDGVYKYYIKMGKQHRKETKRRRRTAFIKRQKETLKLSTSSNSIPLAKKIVKEDTPAATPDGVVAE